ncbi:sulfite oxidase heme-binding subunit YedZ [Paraglaciecola aestuariivivens]
MAYVRLLIHLVSLFILVNFYYLASTGQLSADPVEEVLHFTGIGAFNLLLLSLTISPLAKKLKQAQLMTLRRPLGLYAFLYAIMHFLSFIAFEVQFNWLLLIEELIKRPYISVGFVAVLILTLLAITSWPRLRKKLGRKWQTIHNLVYLSGLLISLHYLWSVKSLSLQPIVYAVLFSILMLARVKKIKKLSNLTKTH